MNETTSNGASKYTHRASLGGEEMLLSAETLTLVLDGLVARHPGAGVPQVVALSAPVASAAEQSEREFERYDDGSYVWDAEELAVRDADRAAKAAPVYSDFGAGNQVVDEKAKVRIEELHSKLFEIQAAPEGCWGELLKLCETGATVKQLRDRVREIKIAKGGRTAVMRQAHARGNTVNAVVAAAAKRNEKRATKTASARATVNLRAQEWSIALLARKSPGEKAAKPARSIAQQPSGSIVVEGAGTISFSLFEGDGGAICVDVQFTPEARAS